MVLSFRGTIRLALLLAGAALACSRAAAVSLVPADTPIPDELVLVNFNNTGLDWVYAGPYKPDAVGQPHVHGPEYRAIEGWRHATNDEWALRPSWTDFILPGFSADDVLNDVGHHNYRYASEYWSLFDFVDVGEAAIGLFYRDYPGHPAAFLQASGEAWYVRTSQAAAVPDEAAVSGLLGLACTTLFAARRLRRFPGLRFRR